MTLYNIIVLLLFVLMWVFCTYEVNSKGRIIRKLDAENSETTDNYNQLVKDYNDIVDFLEKHHTKEELKVLFKEHRIDKFIGENSGMNPETEETIRRHLRETIDSEEQEE